MIKKKQKCYIYTRDSTAIQVDGYSLEAQKYPDYGRPRAEGQRRPLERRICPYTATNWLTVS